MRGTQRKQLVIKLIFHKVTGSMRLLLVFIEFAVNTKLFLNYRLSIDEGVVKVHPLGTVRETRRVSEACIKSMTNQQLSR